MDILINIFVLLLFLPQENRYFVELRSLKNLLKSILHNIENDYFLAHQKVRLYSSHNFVMLYSSSKILMMEIDDLEKMITYDDVADVVSLLVLNGSPCYMNGSGKVTILENQEKIFECSPLLNPISSSFVIENRIYVLSNKFISSFTSDSPLDYENYETEKTITTGDIGKFGEDRLMIFDKFSQTCFVWEKDKPKNPSHQLCFGSSEYTVDVACDEENLYSLTSAGVVSVWKLKPNGRKYRDQLFTTYLNHCTKLLLTYSQKFVILTNSEVHFVVFGIDSTSGQQ
eukprot:NP_494845.3 Uncharacterized protein CELE_F41C3.6 [Caenorhabditis elegans]